MYQLLQILFADIKVIAWYVLITCLYGIVYKTTIGSYDEWVKDWLKIKVSLGGIDLKPYYYFSRSTQRVNQAINDILSPNAQQCLKSFLAKSDSEREKAVKLSQTLSDSECTLVTDAICEEMLKTEEIDMDIFKSFIDILSCKMMIDKAVKLIKKMGLC